MPCYGGRGNLSNRSKRTTHGFRIRKLNRYGYKILNNRRREKRKKIIP